MGIPLLLELLNSFGAKVERGLSEFRGNIAIVDGSHRLLKQSIGRITKDSKDQITNANGKLILHLYVTFITVIGMLDYGIQPIFVFEGQSPQDKKNTCAERKRAKENARKKCDEIEDKTSDDYFKNLKKCFHLTSAHYDEVKHLLDLAGIPYVVAPGEGDPQCAAISKFYKLPVITDDTDILAYGGAKIWRDFSLAGKKTLEVNKQSILEKMFINANKILEENGESAITAFTHENFIDYCIMLGTDYTPDSHKTKISGVPSSELFRIYVLNNFDVAKTCDYIAKNCVGAKISHNFVHNWARIKAIYMGTPVIHPENVNVLMNKPRIEELVEYLCNEIGLDRTFVTDKIMGLEKNYQLFNDIYNGNACGQENDFGNFRSYQLKHHTQKLSQMWKRDGIVQEPEYKKRKSHRTRAHHVEHSSQKTHTGQSNVAQKTPKHVTYSPCHLSGMIRIPIPTYLTGIV